MSELTWFLNRLLRRRRCPSRSDMREVQCGRRDGHDGWHEVTTGLWNTHTSTWPPAS